MKISRYIPKSDDVIKQDYPEFILKHKYDIDSCCVYIHVRSLINFFPLSVKLAHHFIS